VESSSSKRVLMCLLCGEHTVATSPLIVAFCIKIIDWMDIFVLKLLKSEPACNILLLIFVSV